MDKTSSPDSYDSLMARALAKIDARDFPGATALMESALRIRSAPEVWQLLGITWKECGENSKAREALLRVVELRPEDPRAWVNLGAIELDLRLFDEAAQHYRLAVELAPRRADLRIWLANAYDRAGHLSDALESYRQAEALDPNNAEVFYERGLAYRNHGRFADAARDFKRAYELDPARENALELAREMAVAPHRVSPEAAAAVETAPLDDALERSPRNAVFWNNRGWQHWQNGDTDTALSDFERAIQLQPDYLQARVNYAEVLRRSGRTKESEQEQRKIVEIDPNFAHGYYNLAVTLFESQRFDEALPAIDRAIAIESTDADYFAIRGSILEGLQRKAEALSEFTRALGIDKNHTRAYFMRGNMQFDLGRLQTAVADYTRALEIGPDIAEVYLNRGLCYFALDRFDEARRDLERALQLKAGFGVAHLRLAQIARRESRAADANRHLAAASSLGFSERDWE
jgi:tetratricopeptide (TPR) repeat protein